MRSSAAAEWIPAVRKICDAMASGTGFAVTKLKCGVGGGLCHINCQKLDVCAH